MAILKISSKNTEKSNKSKNKVMTVNKNKKTPITTETKRPNNNKPVVAVQKNSSSKKKKKKKALKRIVNFFLAMMILLANVTLVGITVFCAYVVITAPKFDTDKFYNKEATIFYDRNGVEFARVGLEQRELIYYDDLPEVFIDALVATEDARFFQHNGFDVVRFVKASLGQVAGQSGAGGASTLTMQLAKNTFSVEEDGSIAAGMNLDGIVRKFHDIYISVFLIEKEYTKEQIIELYVNRQFLGSGAWGIEQAAQTYFGKSINELTLTESALLAGIFNAPSSYNPFASIDLATKRRATVLSLMVRHGYITEEQEKDANDIPIESLIIEPSAAQVSKYQQFIDIVCEELVQTYGMDPYSVPMEVFTTMDPTMQDVMISLNEGTAGYKWINDYVQVGIAVTDVNDGSIRAVDGGRNQYGQRLGSRATIADKQPGSTIKPFMAYGPYIEYNNGNPGTMFYDLPYTYSNGQSIKNHNNTYAGAVTMRTALVLSKNIPAIQAFQAVDKTKIAEFANAAHIDFCNLEDKKAGRTGTDCTLYEPYAIGGGLEVSPLQMAAAYAILARGGYYIEPYSYTKIILRETGEVKEHKYVKEQAMSEETAYMLTDILITAKLTHNTGGPIKVSGTDIAAKTGTSTFDSAFLKAKGIPASTSSADNWTISYSPDYVISIWYGVDHDKVSKTQYTTANSAGNEKRKISTILGNKLYKTNSKFTKPAGIVSVKYEKETFPTQLPSAYTPSSLISTELFKKGTEPSETSNRFDTLKNPTNVSTEVSNSQINISWSSISTPDAINDTYLEALFNDNYGTFAERFYSERVNYNHTTMGLIGYQVYLSTTEGLVPVGYTTNNFYVYNAPYNGTYTFVIKSAYSVFKSNMSPGATVTATVTNGVGYPVSPDDNDEPDDDNQE